MINWLAFIFNEYTNEDDKMIKQRSIYINVERFACFTIKVTKYCLRCRLSIGGA